MAYCGWVVRVFYGFKRPQSEYAPDCEKHYVDWDKDRLERTDMLDMALTDGDEVIIRQIGDLGIGAECTMIRGMIEERGASVVIEPLPEGPGRGRPSLFQPDDAQDERIKRLYLSPNPQKVVLDRAREIMGNPNLAWHSIKNRYGPRGHRKSRKPKST